MDVTLQYKESTDEITVSFIRVYLPPPEMRQFTLFSTVQCSHTTYLHWFGYPRHRLCVLLWVGLHIDPLVC